MNARNAITNLVQVTSRLIGVLEREIEILRVMRPSEIEKLQQQKLALIASYESQVMSLASQPDRLEALQPVLRNEFERVADKLQSTLGANERALGAARNTTQQVLQAIAEEIENSYRGHNGYSATGGRNTTRARGPSEPVSLAYDWRF